MSRQETFLPEVRGGGRTLDDTGAQWEGTLRKLHARYLHQLVERPPAPGLPPRRVPYAEVLKTEPQVKPGRKLSGGRFEATWSGWGPPDFLGQHAGLSFRADAKAHKSPPPAKRTGKPRADFWAFWQLRGVQAVSFDRSELQGAPAFVLFGQFFPDGSCTGHLIPWLEQIAGGPTLRDVWWAWYREYVPWVRARAQGIVLSNLPTDLGRVAVADLLAASIYSQPASQFDYLPAVVSWANSPRRLGMLKHIPAMLPNDAELMETIKAANDVRRAAEGSRPPRQLPLTRTQRRPPPRGAR